MGYVGTTVAIPLGPAGLLTDDPQANIPANAAIRANNISLTGSKLAKSLGSSRYSEVALEDSIVGLFDWWPNTTDQILIAATANGKLWADTGDGTWSSGKEIAIVEQQLVKFSAVPDAGSVTFSYDGNDATSGISITSSTTAAQFQAHLRTIAALANVTVTGSVSNGFLVTFAGVSGNADTLTTSANNLSANGQPVTVSVTTTLIGGDSLGVLTPDCCFVAGGAEASSNPRKLFFFSGTSPVVKLTGSATTATGLDAPAADWSNSYPTWGVIYQNRLVALHRHTLYVSTASNHEDFQDTGQITAGKAGFFPIYPGEGDELISAIVYKGVLLLFKRPFGIYVFDWRDTTQNPIITRYSDSFSLASPHAVKIVLDDLFGLANTNSVFSLKASDALGSLEAGDIFSAIKVRNYVREQTLVSGARYSHALYYPEKEIAYFTARSPGSSVQNRMLVLDMSRQNPRLTIETKDQPNCLALRKDDNLVPRPIYGSSDGYVYLLDQTSRNVGGQAYLGEFQTPFIDFSYLDQSLADKVKLFDFLTLSFVASGTWSFFVDVLVDGKFVETIEYSQQMGGILDSFVLDQDRLGELYPTSIRRPLHASGRTISFRIHNNGLNEFFVVERMAVSFRISGEQAKSSA